jgi:hypothetical protein
MRLLNFGVIGAVICVMGPVPVTAQSEFIKDHAREVVRKVGVHLNVSFREPIDPDVTKGQTYGVSIGLSPGRTNGWKYPVGLTMFSEGLHSPNGEQFAEMNSAST